MLPPKQPSDPGQRELLNLFRQLDPQRRQGLLDYARYLAQQSGIGDGQVAVPAEPLGLPRPAEETVVAAIRRLSENYPMLNRDGLLHDASALMTSHVMQGRKALDVIDDLEELFARAFQVHSGNAD